MQHEMLKLNFKKLNMIKLKINYSVSLSHIQKFSEQKSTKTQRSPIKKQNGQGFKTKNSISNAKDCGIKQKWSCNKAGYFK